MITMNSQLFPSGLVVVCILIIFFVGPATPRILDPNQHQQAAHRRHEHLYERQLIEDPQPSKFVRRCLSTAWDKDLIDADDFDMPPTVVNKRFVFGQEDNELCRFLKGKHAVKY